MAATRKPRAAKPAAPATVNDVSLTERAYKQLEEMITTLQLAPGAVVSEATLSKRLGIGRTPIREALQRLAREKLVMVLPRRGIVVAEVNVRTQLRLIELRREVERLLARLAARRASDEERQAFRDIAAGMEQAAVGNDDLTFMRLDHQLNTLLIAAARNEFTAGAMAMMNGLSRRFWYIHYKQVADLPLAARLHAAEALAIAAGDEDAAAQASDKLIDYIDEFARATVSAD